VCEVNAVKSFTIANIYFLVPRIRVAIKFAQLRHVWMGLLAWRSTGVALHGDDDAGYE
jgi:hypothetical protein